MQDIARPLRVHKPEDYPKSGARRNDICGITISSRQGTFYFNKLLVEKYSLKPGDRILISQLTGKEWFWRTDEKEGFVLQNDRGYLKFHCRQLARILLLYVDSHPETATLEASQSLTIEGQQWVRIAFDK